MGRKDRGGLTFPRSECCSLYLGHCFVSFRRLPRSTTAVCFHGGGSGARGPRRVHPIRLFVIHTTSLGPCPPGPCCCPWVSPLFYPNHPIPSILSPHRFGICSATQSRQSTSSPSALPPGKSKKTPGRAAPKFPRQALQTAAWGRVSTFEQHPVFRPSQFSAKTPTQVALGSTSPRPPKICTIPRSPTAEATSFFLFLCMFTRG